MFLFQKVINRGLENVICVMSLRYYLDLGRLIPGAQDFSDTCPKRGKKWEGVCKAPSFWFMAGSICLSASIPRIFLVL